MADTQYLALLRGINVGGNNIIKMVDLKACFENMGFSDVVTYIQSGNVLFKADGKDKAKFTTKIEDVLSERFSYKSRIVTVTHKELKKVVEEAPKGFGEDLDKYRCDVIFLKEPLTIKEAMKNVRVREGVDGAYAGKAVLYFSRLISRASQSYLTKIITLPMYQNMTIRNWNTTTKLLALMEAGNDSSR
jgi:uncharacterized protein (DUF1697 family)